MHSAASTVRQLRAAPNQSCFEFTLPPTANDSSLSLTTLFRSPVLDQLLADVRRRRFDAVVCWKLDRLGRNMRHLVTLLDELRALDVGFVTIGEGLDTTTPAGRMTFGIIAAVAEFARERTRERIMLALDP